MCRWCCCSFTDECHKFKQVLETASHITKMRWTHRWWHIGDREPCVCVYLNRERNKRNCKCAVKIQKRKYQNHIRFIAVSLKENAKQIHFGWAVIYLYHVAWVWWIQVNRVNASFKTQPAKSVCLCEWVWIPLGDSRAQYSPSSSLEPHALCIYAFQIYTSSVRAQALLFFYFTYTRFVCIINKTVKRLQVFLSFLFFLYFYRIGQVRAVSVASFFVYYRFGLMILYFIPFVVW